MFYRFIAWVMTLLKTIWISEKIEVTPVELNQSVPLEIEVGDIPLETLQAILKYSQEKPSINDDPFDKVLYRTIDTPFENYSKLLAIADALIHYLQDQIKNPDDNIYLDDPLIVAVARALPKKKEVGAFIFEGGKRDMSAAFYDLLVPINEIYSLYVSLKTHPTLSEFKKDYCVRTITAPLESLKQHLDIFYLHGKLDDSEKETHQSHKDAQRSRQTN